MAGKGGKRPGAGRKPSTVKGIAKKLPREPAEIRGYGKARQTVKTSGAEGGPIRIITSIPRPGDYPDDL